MSESKKSPKLRFAGFNDEWEQRKLGEVLTLLKDGTHGTHQDSDEGPYLLSAKNIKNGQIIIDDSSERKISWEEYKLISSTFQFKKNDVVLTIVGSIGESAILENTSKLTFQRSVALLRPNSDLMSQFLKTNIESLSFQKELNDRKTQSAQAGVYLGELARIPIFIPTVAEQTKIGAFFSKLDTAITLHQRKCDKLKKIKGACLSEMFPKSGEKVPKRRFAGFTDAWEQRKFSELYESVTEKNDLSYGVDKNITVATMQFKDDIRVTAKEYLRTYNIFKLGDIAFEGHQSKEFRYGRFVENDIGNGIVSHIFAVFRPKINYDIYFWKYAINNERLMRQILSRCTKASTMMNDLVTKDFLEEMFLVPSLSEQQKIGAFFSRLDSSITLHQRECEKLKKIKAAYLKEMFI
jgi:type I restriction enzyme S subunit